MNEICLLILENNSANSNKISELKKELRAVNDQLAQRINDAVNAKGNKIGELLGTLDAITITHFKHLLHDNNLDADRNLFESKKICGEIAKYIIEYISGVHSKCSNDDQSSGTKAREAAHEALKSSASS